MSRANLPPVIQPIAAQQVNEAQLLAVTPSASDPDGDVLSWSGSGLPSGASVNALTGVCSWTPSYTQSGLYNGVVVTANDGHDGVASLAFSIGVVNVNRPPVVVAIPRQMVNEGATLVVTPSASDPDGNTLHWWGDITLPGGTVDPTTGVWMWTPGYLDAGTYLNVGLVCSDGDGGVVTATFRVTVSDVNRPPTLTPVGAQTDVATFQLKVSTSASDPDGDSFTWSGTNLPGGALVNPLTGYLSWTPTNGQIGTFNGVTLKATDTKGAFGVTSFTVTVRSTDRTPTVQPIPNYTLKEGLTLTIQPVGSDPDGDKLVWFGKKMPPLATIDSLTGYFQWNVQWTEAGNDYDSIRVYAKDPYGQQSYAQFNVAVTDSNGPPVLDLLQNQTIGENTLLTIVPLAADPDTSQVLVWSGGNLPAGAVVDPHSGVLTWRPAYGQAGAYNDVRLAVTDPFGASSSDGFAITVLAQSSQHYFGTFRNQTSSLAGLRMSYLGASWTYRDIKPLLDKLSWQTDADLTDSSTCAAGTQMVFNLIAADTVSIGDRYFSRKPADQASWDSVVRAVVDRYNGDGINDMPNLPCPVHYWHIEEEGTFWVDTDANYVAHFNETAALIKSVDPTAQVIAMGVSSDQAWNAAYYAGFVKTAPPNFLAIAQDSLTLFLNRTTTIMQQCAYDAVDLHVYETASVIQGKLAWLRSLMPAPAKPVWCFEGGGPYASRQQGYSDTLNAYSVLELFSEALANGVQRFTFPYLQPSAGSWDDTPGYNNINLTNYGLFCDGSACTKPSYETYRVMTQRIGDYTAVQDISPRVADASPDTLLRMRFTTPHGPVDIVWAPAGARVITLRAASQRGAFSNSVRVTHPVTQAGVTADQAVMQFVPFVDGEAVVTVDSEPLLLEGPFDVSLPASKTSGGGASVNAAASVELAVPGVARDGTLHLSWRTAPGEGVLSFDVVSAAGRLVAHTTVPRAPGDIAGELQWHAASAAGTPVAPGLYWVQLRDAAGHRVVRRVLLVR